MHNQSGGDAQANRHDQVEHPEDLPRNKATAVLRGPKLYRDYRRCHAYRDIAETRRQSEDRRNQAPTSPAVNFLYCVFVMEKSPSLRCYIGHFAGHFQQAGPAFLS